ncbi:MAG: FAD-dependent oxidoreductase [Planctomycetota bacterium]|nr:FAD-dependent oxidoreductase [Planctomycetota bacterium]
MQKRHSKRSGKKSDAITTRGAVGVSTGGTATLTDARLKAEIERCEYCAEKPCREACPCDCSPADFMMAARNGALRDFKRAAALILGNNPLGGVCGIVCPDRFCMKACVRAGIDRPVNIPAVQAAIVRRAHAAGTLPGQGRRDNEGAVSGPGNSLFAGSTSGGKKVAIIGAGPAGLGAAAVLARLGYAVDVFDSRKKPGGMTNLIPRSRLADKAVRDDLKFIGSLGHINLRTNRVADAGLLRGRYDAVVVAAGLDSPLRPAIRGQELAVAWTDYLGEPDRFNVKNKRVGIIGGGAVAVDCAVTACEHGAAHVELFALERLGEMPLTAVEFGDLLKHGIHVSGRTSVVSISARGRGHGGSRAGNPRSGIRPLSLRLCKVALKKGMKFHPRNMTPLPGTGQTWRDVDCVIVAIGSRGSTPVEKLEGVFYVGDLVNGPTTVVEAVAAGKNAALSVDSFIRGTSAPTISLGKGSGGVSLLPPAGGRGQGEGGNLPEKATKSRVVLAGRRMLPVPIDADFFGRKIPSPFLLSAAPPSDGYDQMRKAYEAGWAGGVMKTAFDNLPIHIPSEYMFALTPSTYGNCDNVSGHSLDRVCREVDRLVKEFPDRLTIASTGGPVSGNDDADMRVWQSNTKKLESAGAMGIEYSLSCPQGGDGTKGDIVSQDPELTAKIIGWVMEASNSDVPSLFKLTAAVTSIFPIIAAIKEVFARYPHKKAGVTLANTFPALAFRNPSRERGRAADGRGSRDTGHGTRRHGDAETRGHGAPETADQRRDRQKAARDAVGGSSSCRPGSSQFALGSSDFRVPTSDFHLSWERGVVVGMSGEGVLPISFLTLANVSRLGVVVSGNGGVMDYKGAADFLALGARTVQFCTIVMKYGYGIIEELCSGLSWLMEERGFRSVDELVGCASRAPGPIVPFMELPSLKKISAVDEKLCVHCGNCTRCPYMAISLDREKTPETDPAKCIGCSICAQKCVAGALYMRDRTIDEIALLSES